MTLNEERCKSGSCALNFTTRA